MSFVAASNLKVRQWEEPERLLDFTEIRVHSTSSFVTMQRLYDPAKIVVYYTRRTMRRSSKNQIFSIRYAVIETVYSTRQNDNTLQ